MDEPRASNHTSTILEPGTEDLLTMLLTGPSRDCMVIPAALSTEAIGLLRSSGVCEGGAGRVATLLELSIVGASCSLSLGLCDATAVVLGDVAATALSGAVRAGELAEIFRLKSLMCT
jgi:type 1 fimbria pilin